MSGVFWVKLAAGALALNTFGIIGNEPVIDFGGVAVPAAAAEAAPAPAPAQAPVGYTGPTSGQLGLAEVASVAASTGLRGEALVTAISISGWDGAPNPAESHGRACVHGDQSLADSKWSSSIGLWQVRSLHAETGTGKTRDAARLCDPSFNAASMMAISSGGTNWRPWTVYTNGKYRDNLDQARAHVNSQGLG